MMKKILSILTSAVMAAACLSGGFSELTGKSSLANESLIAYAESVSKQMQYGDYLYYRQIDEDEDGVYDYVEIRGFEVTAIEIEIPAEIDGLPVTGIKNSPLNGCASLERITIPDSVETIGDYAFCDCEYLTSITIPDSVTSIGEWAFAYCASLESITIPNNVTSIGERAFYNCINLASITILNPECEIYDEESTIPDTTTIYGYENSTAQAYAEKYDRTFAALDEEQPVTTPAATTAVTTTSTTAATTVLTTAETTNAATTETIPVTTETVPVTTEPEVQGDANGDGVFNTDDVEYIMLYSIGYYKSIEEAADYNHDGVIDIYDACDAYGSIIGAESGSEPLIKNPELSVGNLKIAQGKNATTSLYLKNCNAKVGIIRESCELNHGISTLKISDDIIMALAKDCIVFVNPKGILIDEAIADLGFFATNGEQAGEVYDISFSFDVLGNSAKEQCTPVINNGSVTITDGTSTSADFLRGDVNKNGKIDLYDTIEICRYIMGMRTFTDEEKVIADYDGNSVVDLYDAIGIAKELLPK